MALLYMDGFDHYGSTQANRKWTYALGGVPVAGRFNGAGWNFNNCGTASAGNYVNVSPGSTTTTFACAFQTAYGDPTNPIVVFQDSSNNTQVDLRVTSNAAFQITRDATILNTTVNNVFAFGFWNYMEFQWTLDSVAGAYTLKVNGVTVATASSVNTLGHSGTGFTRLRIQPFSFTNNNNANVMFDDLCLMDSTGSVNNGFLGECRIQTNWPASDGAETDWVPSAGSAHYAMVNETVEDDDTTYIAGSAPGNIDIFNMQNFTFTGSIFAVQLNVTQRKDDVGSRSIAPEVRIGGTDYFGPTAACQSDYTTSQALWQDNPATSNPWTVSQLNTSQFGVKVIT